MTDLKYDVVVIGAGTAGLAAYRAVVAQGLSALLIEKEDRVTTTCAQSGCMPSKLLIASAKAAKNVKNSSKFGVNVGNVTLDEEAIFLRVQSERDRFVGFVERGAATLNKIHGLPKFITENKIHINGQTILAEKFIIATGTSVRVPEIFKNVPGILTNESVFELKKLPKKLLVVGAGVIGLELGVAFAQLGVSVTLLNNLDTILGLSDKVQASVKESLKRRLDYQENSSVLGIKVKGESYLVNINGTEVEYDKILLAAGRVPNITNLGLENVWRDVNFIKDMDPVTHHVKGTPIYLAGDVDGTRPLLHEAAFYGKNVGDYVATGKRTREQDMTKMAVVFTDPQIMMIGERFNASTQFMGSVDFSDQGRSRVDGVNEGILEVYFDKHTKLLTGAQMSGPDAEHIAHILAWAIEMGATLDKLLSMPFYHPVIEEGLRTALRDAATKLN